MGGTGVSAASHVMIRVDFSTAAPFDDFRSRFEEATPAFDVEPFQRIIGNVGSWADVRATFQRNSARAMTTR